jgi:hypothetical protein
VTSRRFLAPWRADKIGGPSLRCGGGEPPHGLATRILYPEGSGVLDDGPVQGGGKRRGVIGRHSFEGTAVAAGGSAYSPSP